MWIEASVGVGRHFETVSERHIDLILKATFAYEILYYICVTLIKVSILLFYYRIFGVGKTFKRTVYVALGVVVAWCIAIVLGSIFQCTPVQAAWIRPFPHSKCINNNGALLGVAISNVVIDCGILILPVPSIWNLNLSVRRKIALTAIFLIGAL